MGISITFFDSVDDLVRYVEGELRNATQLYSSFTNRMEAARLVHQDSKRKDSNVATRLTTSTEVAGFKVLSNPAPEHELSVLDDALETLQEQIDALARIRKELVPKLQDNIRIAAIFEDMIPRAFMYYTRN